MTLHTNKQIVETDQTQSRSLLCVAKRQPAGQLNHKSSLRCFIVCTIAELLNTASAQQALRMYAHHSQFDVHLDHHNSSFLVTVSSALGYTMYGRILPLRRASEQAIHNGILWQIP